MRKQEQFAYQCAKSNARYRNIEFLFGPNEWVDWWEDHLGIYWMKLRGCRKGQYVMARDEDEGPYAPWNVECITVEQNFKDCAKYNAARGGRIAQSKLNDKQVAKIYLTDATLSELAKQYGVRPTAVQNIKRGKTWTHVTKGLGPPPKNRRGRPKVNARAISMARSATGNLREIARKCGISVSTTWKIRTGQY